MNKSVYILMIISFVVGMVELLIGGILNIIADDIGINISLVGLLITIYALILGIFGPIMLVATAKIERKRLMLVFLLIFLFGNIISVISTTFVGLLIGRIVTAISASLLISLCLVLAPHIVNVQYRSRALGLVSMGISASIVLGLPIGIALGSIWGWRSPFLLIIVLTLLSLLGVYKFLKDIPPRRQRPIKQQIVTLKDKSILFTHITTILFFTGHTVLYAYFTPYLTMVMNQEGLIISISYFVFGIAAIVGGGVGGIASDAIGEKKTMFIVILLLSLVLFGIKFSVIHYLVFYTLIVLWGITSWALTPPIQSYLVRISYDTSDIQQSLNNSSLHFGIALGSFVGSMLMGHIELINLSFVGAFIVALALLSILLSIKQKDG